MTVASTLAYCVSAKITVVKIFIIHAPGEVFKNQRVIFNDSKFIVLIKKMHNIPEIKKENG
jgi:hypothetical protein